MIGSNQEPLSSSTDKLSISDPSWIYPRAAYLHIPFCAHKCGYCDFASVAGQDDLADLYLIALESEIRRTLSSQTLVDTIFVGGGTPTRMNAGQLEQFCRITHKFFHLAPDGEYTVEANPGTLDTDKVEILKSYGVTRISLGAQSFNLDALAALERNHKPSDVFRSVDMIRGAGLNWSIDLIFGAPGSDASVWEKDMEVALSLVPDHLSCYGLIYEKGTALWKQLQAGLVEPVADET